MRFLRVGTGALLVECDDLEEVIALVTALSDDMPRTVDEIVPGARTLLLRSRRSLDSAGVRHHVMSLSLDAGPENGRGTVLDIPVHYDGEDLEDVASLVGLSVPEVIARHTAPVYDVAFTGFAPGFAYLSGGDPRLCVPRHDTPRTRIPESAVAIAGEFTGIYPRPSPGGWRLIGSTPLVMWDSARESPALLQPGDRVRFVATRERLAPRPAASHAAPTVTSPALEVMATGPVLSVQDEGRPGMAHLGVSRSGAMDPAEMRAANRVVGNAPDCAVLEAAYGGVRLRAHADLVVAVCGAPVEVTVIDGGVSTHHAMSHPVACRVGQELAISAPQSGVYSYIAVRGGIDVSPEIGSRATDILAGLGPAALRPGDQIPVGPAPQRAVCPSVPLRDRYPDTEAVTWIDIVLGPRDDWFTADSLEFLLSGEWEVTAQSNRVGMRLRGERPLTRCVEGELPSEATIAGALQIPASGEPVLFAADHPVTGGYPVIGCVPSASLALAAQVPIGGRLRFRAVFEAPPSAGERGDAASRESFGEGELAQAATGTSADLGH